MNSIRGAAIGTIIGAIFWAIVAIIYTRPLEEVITVALIGATVGGVFGSDSPKRILTLRDVQDIIERGEYDEHPISKWQPIFFCDKDGVIRPIGNAPCPSPYHPYPPPRAPGREILYLGVGSICLALIYSILTNEALTTLVVTFLLLIVSVPIFLVLNLGFTILIAKFAPSAIEVKTYNYTLDILIDLGAGLWAVLIVALLRGELPDITWFLIEFSIGVSLKIPLLFLNARVQARFA